MQTTWVATLRSILELLYFVSGIAIAVAAFWGLKQLRITKQIARMNAKREAIKLASEQCTYFAEKTVPEYSAFVLEYKKLGLTFLNTTPEVVIDNGEIVKNNIDFKALGADLGKIQSRYTGLANHLESFAIPFATGICDNDIGYEETGRAFCSLAQNCMPLIMLLRKANTARYASIVKLYVAWNNRLAAEAVEPKLKSIQEVIKAAEKGKIETLGFEF